MKYRVTGVDRTTGRDVVRTIAAPSRDEAERIALQSMLVERVEADAPQSATVVEYASPRPPGAPKPGPRYDDIPRVANWVRLLSAVLDVAGGLTILLPVGAAAAGVLAFRMALDLGPILILLLVGVLSALPLFALAGILRLMASMSLAVHDIARNSFVTARLPER